jgi:hypothetical protein
MPTIPLSPTVSTNYHLIVLTPILGTAPADAPAGAVYFPANQVALLSLTNQQFNALEQFYGVPFFGNIVGARQSAFRNFIL